MAVPALKTPVTDLTGTLTAQQTQDLDRILAAFEREKGSQVAVLIVPTTRPETIEQYGIRVADAWKLGRKGVDDGAILLVAKDDRSLRIEVGYGLEGVLPDATAERIISETIAPRFKAGDFYDGILVGVRRITGVIRGEPLPPPPARRVEAQGRGSIDTLFAMVFAAAVVGSFLSLVFGRLTAGIVTGGVTGLLAWLLLSSVLMALLAGAAAFVLSVGEVFRQGYRSGGWPGGPWSGGGWSAGGGSSGGTWGGGGGGFGGGGASGRW